MVEGEFKVRSLEAIDTIGQDADVGVIRVAGVHLKELGGRNALVRVSVIRDGKPAKSLVRIVRAKTTEPALKTGEIALQYDDRLALGINRAGQQQNVLIEQVRAWQFLSRLRFLLSHTSPLVKRQTGFAIAVLIVGVIAALILGSILP